jgi:hypothetical protein
MFAWLAAKRSPTRGVHDDAPARPMPHRLPAAEKLHLGQLWGRVGAVFAAHWDRIAAHAEVTGWVHPQKTWKSEILKNWTPVRTADFHSNHLSLKIWIPENLNSWNSEACHIGMFSLPPSITEFLKTWISGSNQVGSFPRLQFFIASLVTPVVSLPLCQYDLRHLPLGN